MPMSREFLAAVPSARRREDAEHLTAIMTNPPERSRSCGGRASWASASGEYTNTTGTQERRASPAQDQPGALLHGGLRPGGAEKRGRTPRAKGCLYIKDLRAVDEAALREIITASLEEESPPGGRREQRGHVLLIGINRPEKRNADLELIDQFRRRLSASAPSGAAGRRRARGR